MVLAILGVALSVLAARGAWHSDSVDVRSAADAIADASRATRAFAFRSDRPATMRIDTVAHVVRPAHGPAQTLSRRVTVAPAAVDVTFEPDGANSGASVRISEGRVMRRVDIDWLSGRIVVSAK